MKDHQSGIRIANISLYGDVGLCGVVSAFLTTLLLLRLTNTTYGLMPTI